MFYFYGSLVITGFICGLLAGLFNEYIVGGIFSGIVSLFFGYLIIFIPTGIYGINFFLMYPLNYYIILSLLFGGIGGLSGNQIRIRRKY
jgi:hypothetical protein